MKSFVYALFTLFCFATLPAVAEELSSRDFGYGYMIEAKEKGAVYSLPIPGEVYRTVRRSDLGDIRIFNGAGEPVPHALRVLASLEASAGEYRDVPFFPLYEEEAVTDGNVSLSVRRNADGTIIDIDSGKIEQQGERKPSGYLLDLGDKPEDIFALEFFWKVDKAHASNSVMVQQSSDLQHWWTLVHKATLVDLEYGGNRVQQRKINLPHRSERYLKIIWLQKQQPSELQRVKGQSRVSVSRQNMQWVSLYNGTKGKADEKIIIDFATEYRLPVRSVRLQFPEVNSIVSASVQSRMNQENSWREQCRGVFYALEINGERLQSEPCSFSPTNDREWRLIVLDDGSGLAGSGRNLILDLGWQSDELLFMARGTGPFVFAYGSGKLENDSGKSSSDMVLTAVQLHKDGNILQPAELGKRIELGGEKALVPPPPPTPWKIWLLWSVLVAGVIGMAIMAINLTKELRQKGKE